MDNADYIIDNKMKRIRDYKAIDRKEFTKYHVLKVEDQPVSVVYKRIDKF